MLIKSWLNLMDNNPELLLEALDVATRPEVCQHMADCILERCELKSQQVPYPFVPSLTACSISP